MKNKTPILAEIDRGDNAGQPHDKGTRIYSREGTEYGVSTGVSGRYVGEAGNSDRIRVLWPDGKYTKPVLAGVRFKNDRWQIA